MLLFPYFNTSQYIYTFQEIHDIVIAHFFWYYFGNSIDNQCLRHEVIAISKQQYYMSYNKSHKTLNLQLINANKYL